MLFFIFLHMFAANYPTRKWGTLLFRLAVGGVFMVHGWAKLQGGPQQWNWLGSQLAPFGINFAPEFWGFMAMFSELFGGALIILGFLYMPALILTAITMIVAMTTDAGKITAEASFMQNFTAIRPTLSLFLLSIAGLLMGPGRLSIDALIAKKIHKDCEGHCEDDCAVNGTCAVSSKKTKKTVIKA